MIVKNLANIFYHEMKNELAAAWDKKFFLLSHVLGRQDNVQISLF
jgi:hypothetical protein